MFETILWALGMLFLVWLVVIIGIQMAYASEVAERNKARYDRFDRRTVFVDKDGKPWQGPEVW